MSASINRFDAAYLQNYTVKFDEYNLIRSGAPSFDRFVPEDYREMFLRTLTHPVGMAFCTSPSLECGVEKTVSRARAISELCKFVSLACQTLIGLPRYGVTAVVDVYDTFVADVMSEVMLQTHERLCDVNSRQTMASMFAAAQCEIHFHASGNQDRLAIGALRWSTLPPKVRQAMRVIGDAHYEAEAVALTPWDVISALSTDPRFYTYFKHVYNFNPDCLVPEVDEPISNTTTWFKGVVASAFDTFGSNCADLDGGFITGGKIAAIGTIPTFVTSTTGAVLSETALFVPADVEAERLLKNFFSRHLERHIPDAYTELARRVSRMVHDSEFFKIVGRVPTDPGSRKTHDSARGRGGRHSYRASPMNQGGGSSGAASSPPPVFPSHKTTHRI